MAAALPWTARALEIVLSGDDFDADIAERYGWVNRTLDDADLNSFVDTLVRRLASFDHEALGAAKAQINRFGMPTSSGFVEQRHVLPNPGVAQCAGTAPSCRVISATVFGATSN